VGGTPAQEARLVQRRRVPVADMVSVVVAHEVQRPHVDRTAEPVHLLIGRPYVLAVSVSNRLDMVRPRAAGRVCNLPSSPASSCCTAGVTRGFVQENGLPPATSSVTSTPCPSSTDPGSSPAIRSAGSRARREMQDLRVTLDAADLVCGMREDPRYPGRAALAVHAQRRRLVYVEDGQRGYADPVSSFEMRFQRRVLEWPMAAPQPCPRSLRRALPCTAVRTCVRARVRRA
jgi:hypothetical protein